MTADLALGMVLGAATCVVVPAVLLGLGAWWLWRVESARGRGRVPW